MLSHFYLLSEFISHISFIFHLFLDALSHLFLVRHFYMYHLLYSWKLEVFIHILQLGKLRCRRIRQRVKNDSCWVPERKHSNPNLLDLKICALATFGCAFEINSPKQAVVHYGQHEREVIFCITLAVIIGRPSENTIIISIIVLIFLCFPKAISFFLLPIQITPLPQRISWILLPASTHACILSTSYSYLFEDQYIS